MLKFSGRLSRLIQPSSPFILTAVVGLFALVGLWQVRHLLAQPYHYAWPMRDDYDEYHWYAVDVIRNGPAMSVAPVLYARPFGFLYIYFVALWYRIVGVQPPLVFVIQSAMLGGSVVLLFLAFRDALSRSAQVLLLMSLSAFAFLDIERQYAVQLFSENLLVFEIAAFFYLARRGFVDGRRWARILAFAVLGTITLTRPNAILFVPAALVWVVRRRRGARFWLDVACGVALLVAVSSLMAFRNHAAGGDWTMFPPFTREFLRGVSIPGYENVRSQLRAAGPPEEWNGTRSLIAVALQAWLHHPLLVVRDYGRKILFLAGFLPVVVSDTAIVRTGC